MAVRTSRQHLQTQAAVRFESGVANGYWRGPKVPMVVNAPGTHTVPGPRGFIAMNWYSDGGIIEVECGGSESMTAHVHYALQPGSPRGFRLDFSEYGRKRDVFR